MGGGMYTYHRATEHSPESYIFAKYYCCVIPHQGITAQEAVSRRSDVDVTTSLHRPQRVSDRLVHVHLARLAPRNESVVRPRFLLISPVDAWRTKS